MQQHNRKNLRPGSEMSAMRSSSLDGGVPTRVLVAPWGEVESTSGSFVVDEESVSLVIEAFNEHGTDLPIDYEHQTLGGSFAAPSGQAPAAGWIKGFSGEPGVGLLAQIEWTEQATEMLAAREYRYLSPVAMVRKTDRKMVGLHSAALTNKPAIVNMQPIVNGENTSLDFAEAPLDNLRDMLGLERDTQPGCVLLAASERLVAMKEQQQLLRVRARIEEAIRAGKLVEAQRAWAEALVAKEEQLFDEWLRTAPVFVQTGVTAAPASDCQTHRVNTVANQARSEFKREPLLSRLTTEEAYVANALRAAS